MVRHYSQTHYLLSANLLINSISDHTVFNDEYHDREQTGRSRLVAKHSRS